MFQKVQVETLSCQMLGISRFTKSLLAPYHIGKKVDRGTASRSLIVLLLPNHLLRSRERVREGQRVGSLGQGVFFKVLENDIRYALQ